MNKVRMRLSIIGITALLILGSLSGCTQKDENVTNENNESKTYVEVESAKKETIKVEKELSGKVVPEKEIMIVPKIPGKVKKIYVKVGDKVKKNELLIALDGTEVNLQVAQAQAGYNMSSESIKMSREKLDSLQEQKSELQDAIDKVQVSINDIESQITAALNSLPNKDYISGSISMLEQSYIAEDITKDEFTTSLAQLGLNQQTIGSIITKSELQIQLNTLNQSKLGVETAISSLPFNESTLKAQEEQAKAGLNLAKNTQSGLKLTSPIEGVVSSITVTEDGLASQAMPPITVIDIDNVTLDVNLNEYEAAKVKKGDIVKVYIDAVEDSFNGIVEYVSPAIDQRTQEYSTRIKIDNSSEKIKAGMFARANIILDSKTDAVTISKNCIIRENNKFYVYIIEGDKALKKEITIGIDNGEKVQILSGITEGQQIVNKGQEYLKDGEQIEVVRGDNK